MLSETQAKAIVVKAFSDSRIVDPVIYKNVYLFQVYGPDPDEGEFDPYYSVDRQTGVLKEFSILTDATPSEISKLYEDQKTNKS